MTAHEIAKLVKMVATGCRVYWLPEEEVHQGGIPSACASRFTEIAVPDRLATMSNGRFIDLDAISASDVYHAVPAYPLEVRHDGEEIPVKTVSLSPEEPKFSLLSLIQRGADLIRNAGPNETLVVMQDGSVMPKSEFDKLNPRQGTCRSGDMVFSNGEGLGWCIDCGAKIRSCCCKQCASCGGDLDVEAIEGGRDTCLDCYFDQQD